LNFFFFFESTLIYWEQSYTGSNAAPEKSLQKNLFRKIARFLVSKICPATGVIHFTTLTCPGRLHFLAKLGLVVFIHVAILAQRISHSTVRVKPHSTTNTALHWAQLGSCKLWARRAASFRFYHKNSAALRRCFSGSKLASATRAQHEAGGRRICYANT